MVPNLRVASLLNTKGEIQIGENIFRITSEGTYSFKVAHQKEFEAYISSPKRGEGVLCGENVYRINEYIYLYKTFATNQQDYSLLWEGEEPLLEDDYFDNYEVYPYDNLGEAYASVPEPDYSRFQTFSADRKTWFGKIIQNLIGSTKASTVNFNKKRRVKGSFYFYNYGFYGEIGVKGWTDKKNTIGWSKTPSDELRVGWNHVLLKYSPSPDYIRVMTSVRDHAYIPPQYLDINGVRANAATLIMPNFPGSLQQSIISQGAKAVHSFLKSKFGNAATNHEQADAFLLATPNEIYFLANDGEVRKYGEKSYCHVFAKNFMTIFIGWSNHGGFFLENINHNNVFQIESWVQSIKENVNGQHSTLIGGEVHVCARLGNEWRGMKIVKQIK